MESAELSLPVRLVIALGLGFLAGLERESTGASSRHGVHAGIRTYSIIALFGFGCAWIAGNGATLVLPAGLLAITALTVITNLAKQREGHRGFTSEVAAHLTYVMGALCLATDIWLPMALGILSVILLSEKTQLEGMVDRLQRHEFVAIVRFLVVTLLVLPVLPDREYTRFDINPAKVWKIVVVISSIGFVGYVLVKKFGDRAGLVISGLLGGIVSSTAVSVAMGRQAGRHPASSAVALQASLAASTIMYLRVLVLIGIIGPRFLPALWWKLILMGLVGLGLTLWRGPGRAARADARVPEDRGRETDAPRGLVNPYEVKPALVFAVLFVGLTVVTRLVREAFGGTGLLVMAALVGVTDVDPFLMSVVGGSAEPTPMLGAALILMLATHTWIKGCYFAFPARGVRREAAWRYALWGALHLPLLAI